jgi:hypothetical protein
MRRDVTIVLDRGRIEHVKRGEMIKRYDALVAAGFIVRIGQRFYLADWMESQRSDGAERQRK